MTVSPTPITRTESARARLRELMAHRESGVFLALVIFFVSMFTVSPIFRSPFNLTTILRQISVTSIVAMGQTLVIVSGSFDLSQGSIAGLAAMVTAKLWKNVGLAPPVAIVGATVAFPEAGRDDVIVTGVDDAPEIVEGIRQGTVSFTYVQQPYGQGYLAVYIPWLIKHQDVHSTAKYLDTRITLVDQSNIDTYQDTMKQNFLEIKELVDTEILQKNE